MTKNSEIRNAQLSFVCDKLYEDMKPGTNGNFCDACHKTVIDFTVAKASDLKNTLKENRSVCGRFTKDQMFDNSSKNWHFNRFWAGFFLAVGLGGFINDSKAQIIINDSIPEINISNQKNCDFIVGEIAMDIKTPLYKNGGEKGMTKFLGEQIKISNDSVFGKVIVSFKVSPDGSVAEPKILRSLSPEADSEVLRVVMLLEFEPFKKGKNETPVHFTLPIKFMGNKD